MSFLPSFLDDLSSHSHDGTDSLTFLVPLNDVDDEASGVFIMDDECDTARDQDDEEKEVGSSEEPPEPVDASPSRGCGRSLPKVPSKPILRMCLEETIPINTDRKAWKNLPSPCLETVKMKRVESLNSFLHLHHDGAGGNDDDNDDEPPQQPPAQQKTTLKRTDSKVRFQEITVREYDTTIGDNPSVSYGTPISLCWNYEEREPQTLEEYEAIRRRRSPREMMMNYYQRKNLLIHKCGFTEEEVKAAQRQAAKDKKKRGVTKYVVTTPGLARMEDAAHSLGRKAKRILKKKEREAREVAEGGGLFAPNPPSLLDRVGGGMFRRSGSTPTLWNDASVRSTKTI